ncbi:MAG: hypothetical protein JJU48_05800 [Methylophaga sp.]|nr:hypothetical protein [Methylophaga sp.]
MNRNMQEKIELEHEAAKLFMRLFEKQTGIHMRHIWHNEPQQPDVSCYFDHQRLDIEIAHIYGSEEEARLILGKSASLRTLEVLHELMNIPAEQRLLSALNAILESKSHKRYHSERVWLVLRNANPLWTRQEIEVNRHLVSIPEAHPFEQIWVVGDMRGESGIVQLYPEPD